MRDPEGDCCGNNLARVSKGDGRSKGKQVNGKGDAKGKTCRQDVTSTKTGEGVWAFYWRDSIFCYHSIFFNLQMSAGSTRSCRMRPVSGAGKAVITHFLRLIDLFPLGRFPDSQGEHVQPSKHDSELLNNRKILARDCYERKADYAQHDCGFPVPP